MIRLGQVSGIFRDPVKAMAGVAAESAQLEWNGLAGDSPFWVSADRG